MFKRKRDTAATPEHVQKPVNDNFDTSIDASDINPLEKKKRSREDKRRFLVAYVFALLFIALALVLLSYFNQVRATREQIQNLTEEHNLFSVSALGSIDKLTTQLDTLREERDSLSDANTALENKLSDMQSEQNSLEAKLEVAAAEQEALAKAASVAAGLVLVQLREISCYPSFRVAANGKITYETYVEAVFVKGE